MLLSGVSLRMTFLLRFSRSWGNRDTPATWLMNHDRVSPTNFLPGMASTLDPPCLLSGWDYRCELLCLALYYFLTRTPCSFKSV
jgi:hypothetical protein